MKRRALIEEKLIIECNLAAVELGRAMGVHFTGNEILEAALNIGLASLQKEAERLHASSAAAKIPGGLFHGLH